MDYRVILRFHIKFDLHISRSPENISPDELASSLGITLSECALMLGQRREKKMNISKDFIWHGQPANAVIDGNRVQITTLPHTDLWQRTYYHFRNDNAPMLLRSLSDKYFSFSVKTSFETRQRFDQCGIIMYLDSENWLKASAEYQDSSYQHLGSVVTNHGYSDWATSEIPASIRSIYYRLSRRENDFLIQSSLDGLSFAQMRVCHVWEANSDIRLGIYAASPENSSFEAIFTDFELTECKWQPHDGQPPDSEN